MDSVCKNMTLKNRFNIKYKILVLFILRSAAISLTLHKLGYGIGNTKINFVLCAPCTNFA